MENLDREVNLIENELLREQVKDILNLVPKYFWTAPASSTGKYHPQSDLGEGGLVRHTKHCVEVAESLFRLEEYQDLLCDKDIIYSALILHDTFKYGEHNIPDEHTNFAHPEFAFNFINDYGFKNNSHSLMQVADLVYSHMGQWNTQKTYHETSQEVETIVLPKPQTFAQKFVHLCDYIASRPYLK